MKSRVNPWLPHLYGPDLLACTRVFQLFKKFDHRWSARNDKI